MKTQQCWYRSDSISLLLLAVVACLVAIVCCGCDESSPDDTCYSPEQNYETAYDDGAIGCPCAAQDEGVCVKGTALICETGRWQAVNDGPCWMGRGPGDIFPDEPTAPVLDSREDSP